MSMHSNNMIYRDLKELEHNKENINHEEGKARQKRLRKSKNQIAILAQEFTKNPALGKSDFK